MHYFLRISSPSPSPMVSGRSGSSRHVRKLTLGFEKSTVTSETADVPPFLLAQINFSRAGCLAEGCQHPWTPPPPPGAATATFIHNTYQILAFVHVGLHLWCMMQILMQEETRTIHETTAQRKTRNVE